MTGVALPSPRNYHQVLQVRPGALEEIVTEAYWLHVHRLQNTKNQDAAAARQIEELNEAYEAVISEYALSPDAHVQHPGAAESEAAGPVTIDCYAVLQVDSQASPEVIRLAYELLRSRFSRKKSLQAARRARIEEAYAMLGNPERRAAYDEGAL